MPLSLNEQDQIKGLFTSLVDLLAGELASRLRNSESPLPPSSGGRTELADGLPEREFLTQREAVAWTGLSVSGLRRARENGLPWSKALGMVVYRLGDLRDLMGGHYNGDSPH